jgi:hypothetical protein
MLNVVVLSIIMLNVMAPQMWLCNPLWVLHSARL